MKLRLSVPPPRGTLGIGETLAGMARLVERSRTVPSKVRALAESLSDSFTSRSEEMTAFVDELHRRFTYAPDPTHGELIGPIPFESGAQIDVDDACMFVAALATSVGIRCRFVGARYGRSWTCFLEYEEADGRWVCVDPLRQKMDRLPDERVRGSIIDV